VPKNLLAALVLAAGFVSVAGAAKIFFEPAGIQLDSDAILDIETARGRDVIFEVKLDTTDLPDCSRDPQACLAKLDYAIAYDQSELVLKNPIGPGGDFGVNLYFPGPCPAPAVPPVEQICGINAVHDQGRVASGVTLLLDTVTFTATANLVNDGNSDFGISLLAATSVGGDDYSPFFFPFSQTVEVQSCEDRGQIPDPSAGCPAAVPEPGTLFSTVPGLWVLALALTGWRFPRRQQASGIM
jgi:hypothetical protein